jgi:hypothetical protein
MSFVKMKPVYFRKQMCIDGRCFILLLICFIMCVIVSIKLLLKLSTLHYKERRQLKSFLTQIGPVLPLTPDSPVICFWKWIGWNDYEVQKIAI